MVGNLCTPASVARPVSPFHISVAGTSSHCPRVHIVCHSDNTAVVTQVNRLHAHDPLAGHMLRCLVFFQALYGCRLRTFLRPPTGPQTSFPATAPRVRLIRLSIPPTGAPRPGQPSVPPTPPIGHRSAGGIYPALFGGRPRPSTRKVYAAGWKRYQSFATAFSLPAFPISYENATLFVAFLGAEGLSVSTIKSYLTALRYFRLHSDPANLSPLCTHRI